MKSGVCVSQWVSQNELEITNVTHANANTQKTGAGAQPESNNTKSIIKRS